MGDGPSVDNCDAEEEGHHDVDDFKFAGDFGDFWFFKQSNHCVIDSNIDIMPKIVLHQLICCLVECPQRWKKGL